MWAGILTLTTQVKTWLSPLEVERRCSWAGIFTPRTPVKTWLTVLDTTANTTKSKQTVILISKFQYLQLTNIFRQVLNNMFINIVQNQFHDTHVCNLHNFVSH